MRLPTLHPRHANVAAVRMPHVDSVHGRHCTCHTCARAKAVVR